MEFLLAILAIPIVLMLGGVVLKILAFFAKMGANIIAWFFKLVFSFSMLLLAVLGFCVLYAGFSEREPKTVSQKSEVSVDSKTKEK